MKNEENRLINKKVSNLHFNLVVPIFFVVGVAGSAGAGAFRFELCHHVTVRVRVRVRIGRLGLG